MPAYRLRCELLVLAAGLASATAQAGPPFRTDDPVPVEVGHWEIFLFSTATEARSDTSGTFSGFDINYGVSPDLQLHAAAPASFDAPRGGGFHLGYGDGEIGVKYRFLEEDNEGWCPQAAIYPAIDFPTGNAARGFGTGRTHAFMPVWVQKTFGDWVTFAGGGYWLNPGMGNRNYWYFGWAVQRQLTQDFAVGAEVFHQTPATAGDADQTGFDVGAVYDLSDHYHLMLSAGEGIQGRRANAFSYYLALQLTF